MVCISSLIVIASLVILFYCLKERKTYLKYLLNKNYDEINNKVVNISYHLPNTEAIRKVRSGNVFSKLKTILINDGIVKIGVCEIIKTQTIHKYIQRNYEKIPIYNEPKYTYKDLNYSYPLNEKLFYMLADNIYLKGFLYNFFYYFKKQGLKIKFEVTNLIFQQILGQLKKVLISQKNFLEKVKLEVLKEYKYLNKKYVKINRRFLRKQKSIIVKQSKKHNKFKTLKEKYEAQVIKQDTIIKNTEVVLICINKMFLNLEKQITTNNIIFEIIEKNSDFFNLLKVLNEKKEDFKGCYVIRNIFNGKSYVGQSKNVIKRLHQHFNYDGSCKNSAFYDYYTNPNNNMFEVKFYKCDTKDELDAMERQLIEEYDSVNNGYNRTAGNK